VSGVAEDEAEVQNHAAALKLEQIGRPAGGVPKPDDLNRRRLRTVNDQVRAEGKDSEFLRQEIGTRVAQVRPAEVGDDAECGIRVVESDVPADLAEIVPRRWRQDVSAHRRG
jgi:hypothetical protein